MADLKQGVEYEITAKDNTGPGVESAKATVEKGAKDASHHVEEVAKDFKAGFSPMAAMAAGLTGNFQALGQQMLGLVSRLKGVHMSMMQFSLYSGLVTATVMAVKSLVEYFQHAAQMAEKIKLENASATLKTMQKDSADFSAAMERARKSTEDIYNAQKRETSALQELTKAYNEFAKAQELALAKTPEERKAIETRYASTSAHNEREIAAEQRRLDRAKLEADIKLLEEELKQTKADKADYISQTSNLGGKAIKKAKEASDGSYLAWAGLGLIGLLAVKVIGDQKKQAAQEAKETGEASRGYAQSAGAAHAKVEELKLKIKDAKEKLKNLDTLEEAAEYSEAAQLQTELNEAWAEVDEAEKKEIEEIKEQAIEAAEEVKEAQLIALKEVKDTRMRDLREATEAESAAQQRLAAARQAVDRAWGWYRDKDSLRAQLEEEKADAAAQAQFEKDFARLRFRRDWREAKDLSLDQEAVRRVALAREEEVSAQRAVAETAENTRRAAEALEVIETAFEEGGE